MSSGNALSAVTALFIVAMAWLRTRMHYPRRTPERRSLTPAGAWYFAALVAMLAVGWFAAPRLARELTSSVPVAPAFARAVWFLAAYYLFIPLHLALRTRGVPVFRVGGSPEGGMA
jgi:hypothetical protein